MADGADANDKKANAGEKDPKLKGESTKSTAKQSTSSDSSTSDAIFACLQKIQASQKESEKQVTTLTERMDQFEKQPIHPVAGPSGSYYDDYSYGYFDDCYAEDETWEDDDTVPAKRPRVESLDDKSVLDSNSDMPVGSEHFSGLAKRFKSVENLGDDLDPTLASNVSDLFLKGMNEEQYDKLVKDENTPRPSNCEGLRVVRMNKMIWDVLSPSARSTDLKLQTCAQSVVKATILANTVNKLVGMEQDIKDKAEDINLCTIFEGCNELFFKSEGIFYTHDQHCLVNS